MALKPDRDFDCSYNMGYFWAANGQAPAEEGGIAGVVSAGSGVALDDPGSSGIAPGKGGVNTVDYVADPSSSTTASVPTPRLKDGGGSAWSGTTSPVA